MQVMKKRTIVFVILSVFLLSAFSQPSIRLSHLTNTSWKYSMEGYSNKMSFSRALVNEETIHVFFDLKHKRQRKVRRQSCRFYLANAIPSKFDDSKVGKAKRGKYLVIKVKSRFECLEIIHFTSIYLCVRPVLLDKDVIGGPPDILCYLRDD